MAETTGPESLTGKVAIVTGAGALPGRGMGRAISAALARRGAAVVAVDLDPESAARTAALLEEEGFRATAVTADITSAEGIDRAHDIALGTFGRIDVLVNHAGVGSYDSVLETDDELWERMLALNLTAPFRMTRKVLPHMLERGSGVIVNTVSSAGIAGGRAGVAYTAAKHGVVGLTKNTAFVYGPAGLRAIGICPGYTRSGPAPQIDTAESETGPLLDEVAKLSRRDGRPEELAEVFAFVATDAAAYLNGAIIPVDGGWTAF